MKIKVEKSIKLGLPNYSSVSFGAGVEAEIEEGLDSSVNVTAAFKDAWRIVEEEINLKAEPYHEHIGARKAADTDPAWIREQTPRTTKGGDK